MRRSKLALVVAFVALGGGGVAAWDTDGETLAGAWERAVVVWHVGW